MTINSYMTSEHRACDDTFAQMENSIDSGNFEGGKLLFEKFQEDMLHHFTMEEKVIFPELNSANGGEFPPTTIMIMEHNQMKNLFAQMENALNQKNQNQFLGLSENLLFVMQQHNMKEEQMLYNFADNRLNATDIITKIKAI